MRPGVTFANAFADAEQFGPDTVRTKLVREPARLRFDPVPGSATNVTPPVLWTSATNTPILFNDMWTLRPPPSPNSRKFFRLRTD